MRTIVGIKRDNVCKMLNIMLGSLLELMIVICFFLKLSRPLEASPLRTFMKCIFLGKRAILNSAQGLLLPLHIGIILSGSQKKLGIGD